MCHQHALLKWSLDACGMNRQVGDIVDVQAEIDRSEEVGGEREKRGKRKRERRKKKSREMCVHTPAGFCIMPVSRALFGNAPCPPR